LSSAKSRLGGEMDFLLCRQGWYGQDKSMKIKVESEKIVKAVKKLFGVEMVLESVEDAKEALNLILSKKDIFKEENFGSLKDVNVSSYQEYKTSAVDYKMVFLLDFVFQGHVSEEIKVRTIKELQDFFNKV
jgi:hypothetical protein